MRTPADWDERYATKEGLLWGAGPNRFVEAAWQAIRADPVMQGYYRKHMGKDTKKIIIKVARKLLSRTLAVIKTETPYEIGVVE